MQTLSNEKINKNDETDQANEMKKTCQEIEKFCEQNQKNLSPEEILKLIEINFPKIFKESKQIFFSTSKEVEMPLFKKFSQKVLKIVNQKEFKQKESFMKEIGNDLFEKKNVQNSNIDDNNENEKILDPNEEKEFMKNEIFKLKKRNYNLFERLTCLENELQHLKVNNNAVVKKVYEVQDEIKFQSNPFKKPSLLHLPTFIEESPEIKQYFWALYRRLSFFCKSVDLFRNQYVIMKTKTEKTNSSSESILNSPNSVKSHLSDKKSVQFKENEEEWWQNDDIEKLSSLSKTDIDMSVISKSRLAKPPNFISNKKILKNNPKIQKPYIYNKITTKNIKETNSQDQYLVREFLSIFKSIIKIASHCHLPFKEEIGIYSPENISEKAPLILLSSLNKKHPWFISAYELALYCSLSFKNNIIFASKNSEVNFFKKEKAIEFELFMPIRGEFILSDQERLAILHSYKIIIFLYLQTFLFNTCMRDHSDKEKSCEGSCRYSILSEDQFESLIHFLFELDEGKEEENNIDKQNSADFNKTKFDNVGGVIEPSNNWNELKRSLLKKILTTIKHKSFLPKTNENILEIDILKE